MKFLRRNTDTTNVPPELESYYDQGGWKLWVRRIVGVLALLAILAAIVWAAIWVFNAIAGNDDEAVQETETAQTENQNDAANPNADTESEPDGNNNGGAATDEPDEIIDGGASNDTTTDDAAADDSTTEDTSGDDTLPSTGG